MVNRIIYIFSVIFFIGCTCTESLYNLTRVDYNDGNLRLDGYFIQKASHFQGPLYRIYFLYQNGIVIDGGANDNLNTLNEYAASLSTVNGNKALQSSAALWGVFQSRDDKIKIEIFSQGNCPIKTIIHDGIIIDSGNFVITSFYNGYDNNTSLRNDTFHFREFSPKPDSTNRYIK